MRGVGFDDDVFAFVGFDGDAAGDERSFDERRARRIAERDDDAIAGALLALLFFGGCACVFALLGVAA